MRLTKEQRDKAILWFESIGYHAEECYGKVYLECDFFSVELSEAEVEGRAEQWDDDQSRED
jgi:hypothetical protein